MKLIVPRVLEVHPRPVEEMDRCLLVVRATVGLRWRDGRVDDAATLAQLPMGRDAMDPGFPKPAGEVLVIGHQAGGSMTVGPVHKASDDPAAFRIVPADAPQRVAFMGTCDAEWAEQRAPVWPEDFDARHYQLAPPDQQLPLGAFFEGGERYELQGLGLPSPVRGTLPDLWARVFVVRRGEQVPVELPMRLETILFHLGTERLVSSFRATIEVADDEAEDVALLMAALERRSAPRSVEHYRQAVAHRVDPEHRHRYVAWEGDLIPAGLEAQDVAELDPSYARVADQGHFARRNARRRSELELAAARERLAAQGLDPDEHLPAEIPDEEGPDLRTPEGHVQLEEEIAVGRARRAGAEERARAACEAQGLDFDDLQARVREQGGGPPPTAEQELARLQGRQQLGRHAGVATPHLDAALATSDLRLELEAAAAARREAYRLCAHQMPRAGGRPRDESARLRQAVIEARAAGMPAAGWDLTGVDLSGLDLSGIDLSGSFLEGADLRGSNLDGANLERAVVARADLSGASVEGARLREANLGRARAVGTTLRRADLTAAVLAGTVLSEACLDEATLTGADLAETSLDGVTARGTIASGLRVTDVDLSGVDATGADFSGGTFVGCTFDGSDLGQARLSRATFHGCRGEGACFDGVTGEALRFGGEGSWPRLSLRGARITGSGLRGLSAPQADLRGADLSGSDLSRSDLAAARLEGLVAIGGVFVRSDLRGACLSGANLMDADLRKASLEGADFTEANLFAAMLDKTRVDDATRFDGAELGRVQMRRQVRA